MPDITAEQVKELRDATNVSMMECKKALVEASGDIAKATKILRERGMAVAAKKSSRVANQGLVASVVESDGRTGSLIEVNCETDFVARNEGFQRFVQDLAKRAVQTDASLAEQMAAEVTAKVAEIGENIVIRRNVRYMLSGHGRVMSYIHLGGKVGVLLELSCLKVETSSNPNLLELAKDLTLQIAASNPRYMTSADIPHDVLTMEREIYAKQVVGKPPQIVEKIVDGKLKKFYTEVCLMDQPFVKEQKMSINQLIAAKNKELGDTVAIRRFVRYQVGVA